MKSGTYTTNFERRRHFLGGSDARIIMSPDEAALIRLWKEKRGEAEPEDFSGNLVVQLGVATVQTGDTPRPYGIEPPRPRIEAVRIVDMSESNSWAEFAGLFCATRSAFLDHERARCELKALMPEDAKEASGHGVRAKRSKSGAVCFDLLADDEEGSHAAVQ